MTGIDLASQPIVHGSGRAWLTTAATERPRSLAGLRSEDEITEPVGSTSELLLVWLKVDPRSPYPIAVRCGSGADQPTVSSRGPTRCGSPLLRRVKRVDRNEHSGASERRRQLLGQAAFALPPEVHDLAAATSRDHSVTSRPPLGPWSKRRNALTRAFAVRSEGFEPPTF